MLTQLLQPSNVSISSAFRVPDPKKGEKGLQASQVMASLADVQRAGSRNPLLQLDGAKTNEDYISISFTNATQLANKTGKMDQLTHVLKQLGLKRPSVEDLQSREGLARIQEQVKAALHSMSSDKVGALREEIVTTLDQFLHEAGAEKGGIINTSA